MYRVVLFDFDGTVYDTVEGITKSVQYAVRKQGLDAELEALRCFAGPPLEDMFMERFGFTLEQAKQATRDFRERYLPIGVYESRPFPAFRELLLQLRASGLRLGLATSKPQKLAEELMRRADMLPLFDAICGAGDNGAGNAKWQVIERAMAALGAGAEETVLVGDTKYDVAGAHKVGIPCIGVGYGYAAPGELETAGADAIVPDLTALRTLLLSGMDGQR